MVRSFRKAHAKRLLLSTEDGKGKTKNGETSSKVLGWTLCSFSLSTIETVDNDSGDYDDVMVIVCPSLNVRSGYGTLFYSSSLGHERGGVRVKFKLRRSIEIKKSRWQRGI